MAVDSQLSVSDFVAVAGLGLPLRRPGFTPGSSARSSSRDGDRAADNEALFDGRLFACLRRTARCSCVPRVGCADLTVSFSVCDERFDRGSLPCCYRTGCSKCLCAFGCFGHTRHREEARVSCGRIRRCLGIIESDCEQPCQPQSCCCLCAAQRCVSPRFSIVELPVDLRTRTFHRVGVVSIGWRVIPFFRNERAHACTRRFAASCVCACVRSARTSGIRR